MKHCGPLALFAETDGSGDDAGAFVDGTIVGLFLARQDN